MKNETLLEIQKEFVLIEKSIEKLTAPLKGMGFQNKLDLIINMIRDIERRLQ